MSGTGSTNSTSGEENNLFGTIDRDNVHGLNLTVPEDAKELIKPWDQREDTDKFVESGVDDQVIIHIPFTQNVRIKSIMLKLGRGSTAPLRLRAYLNRPNIVDFSEADNTKPHLDISLLEGETGVVEYPVRTAPGAGAWTSVWAVSLFFVSLPFLLDAGLIDVPKSDSVDEETSRVYYIGFKGDVREAKKDKNTHMDVPAANSASSTLFDRLSEKAGGQTTTAR
ncbi:hypothetical protein VNI00_007497 [Paramarasmius palmivorus]|uniref:PITH domain-containing protein n=1 Tax=Paramarasmius palmivorus TaxID=297713 RepID=A0AAW0D526_9AGAR